MSRRTAAYYESHPNNRYWLTRGHKAWRQRVFEKYRGVCVICGKTATQPHHLLGKRAYPKYRLTVENGIALCYFHHRGAAPGVPTAHGSPRLFDEWLAAHLPQVYNWIEDARRDDSPRLLTWREMCLELESR